MKDFLQALLRILIVLILVSQLILYCCQKHSFIIGNISVVSDASGQHLSVANGFNGGVYTSNDYGDTWTQASTAIIRIDNYDIYCITSSANGKRLVAAS